MNTQELLRQGLAHHEAGRLSEATHCYESVLAGQPTNGDALNLLGLLAYQNMDYARAVEFGAQAAHSRPNAPKILVNYGNALAAAGDNEKALTQYQAALSENESLIAALYGAGFVARRLRLDDEAKGYFSRCLELEPKNHDVAHQLGRLCESNEAWRDAIAYYTLALRNKAGFVPALLGRGGCRQALGDLEDAVDDYTTILDTNPDNIFALTNLGICYLSTAQISSAKAKFRQALDIDSEFQVARLNLAAALRAESSHDDAIRELRTIIGKNPGDASATYMLGAALMESGRKQDALTALNQCLALNPYDRRAMATLAVLLPELDVA